MALYTTGMLRIILLLGLSLSSNAMRLQPDFNTTEELINTCSGYNGLSDHESPPYNIYFFVKPPCHNPCPHSNQTIRYHTATAWNDLQCFVPEQTHSTTSSNDGGYFLNPKYNTIEPTTPCPVGFVQTQKSSMYSNTRCEQSITCNHVTQYMQDKRCHTRTAINPKSKYIAKQGGSYADDTIVHKTNCSSKNMYTIPSTNIEKDHECKPYTTCNSEWLYVRIHKTATSDRSCGVKTTCSQCQYYDPTNHDCYPCKAGQYQDQQSHFSTNCTVHDPITVCGGNHTYSRLRASEMSCSKKTEHYCVTAEVPNGYKSIGKDQNGVPIIQQKSKFAAAYKNNVIAAKYVSHKSTHGPCLSGQFANYFGEFDYVCIQCATCKSPQVTVTECGPYTNTVCGESPHVEAMYAFALAVYLCYIIGALTVYRLHFVTKSR